MKAALSLVLSAVVSTSSVLACGVTDNIIGVKPSVAAGAGGGAQAIIGEAATGGTSAGTGGTGARAAAGNAASIATNGGGGGAAPTTNSGGASSAAGFGGGTAGARVVEISPPQSVGPDAGLADAPDASPAVSDSATVVDCKGVDNYVWVRSQADVNRLSSCTELSTVYVSGVQAELVIDWPILKSIVDTFYLLDSPNVKSLSMPALESVGSGFGIERGSALQGVGVPALKSIRGTLFIDDNSGMQGVSMPALESIGGSLDIDNNPGVRGVSLPALKSIGAAVQIDNNPGMLDVSMPMLESIGEQLFLSSDTSLQMLSLPSLTTIYVNGDRGSGIENAVNLSNLTAFSQFRAPQLSQIIGYVSVSGNPLLCRAMQPDWPELTGHNRLDDLAADPCGPSN